ncbi:MAG: amidohydrolase [Phycisphaeraceae bacterium]|nr:amidohydrolase [Phycisphaeraceae bacterium]
MPNQRLRQIIREAMPELTALRHDLHAHPELAYQERRTAGVVVRELTRLGIRHRAGLAGGTGVVAHLPATVPGADGRGAIALRADMDALPIVERTGAAYASTTPGVMHACGHDGHTANLLGVARVLSTLSERPNSVTLVFQPAEEGGAGGRRLCEEGVLEGDDASRGGGEGGGAGLGEPVRVIYGLHGWPQLPLGVVGSRVGPLLAATDGFTVTVKGTQAHAAYPHLARDPIVAAAQVVGALQTITSRSVGPLESVVVTVATIAGGTARNIIPESVRLGGTVRTLTPGMRVLAKERLFAIAEHTARAMGCEARIEWEEGYPVTENEKGATGRFFETARRALGDARVCKVDEPTMGGEDFSYYGHHVPACFFMLGLCPPERMPDRGGAGYPSLHQPEFDFVDAAMETGIEVMCGLALERD